MPVIQPWYQSTFPPQAPAFTSYWAAFIGERSAMNKEVMAQRLAQTDPRHLQEMLKISHQNVANLQELRAKMQTEDMAGRADVVGMMVRALGSFATAQVNGEARVAEARITTAGSLQGKRFEIEDAARRATGTDPLVETQLKTASTVINLQKTLPEDTEAIYTDLLANAIIDARDSGDQAKVDGIFYSAWRSAEMQGHSAAARAFRDQLGGDPEGYMQRRYGAANGAEFDRAIDASLNAGSFQGTDPMSLLRNVMGELNSGQTSGGSSSSGQRSSPSYGSPGTGQGGGAAAPAEAPGLRGPGAPTGGGRGLGPTNPPVGMLGGLMPVLDLRGIDASLAEARAEEAALRAQLAESGQTGAAADGFGINYLTQNSRTQPHPAQRVIDAIAEAQRTDPRAATEALKLLSQYGGPTGTNARAAQKNIQGHLDRELPAPGNLGQIANGGDFLFAWLADETREILSLIREANTPEETAEVMYRYHRLIQLGDEDLPMFAASAPKTFDVLKEGASASQKAGSTDERMAALTHALELAGNTAKGIASTDRDLHMGELVAEQVANLLTIPDERERLSQIAQLTTATAALPPTLAGDLGRVMQRSLEQRSATGDLVGLTADLEHIGQVASRRAEEEIRAAAQLRIPQGPANTPAATPRASETYALDSGGRVLIMKDDPPALYKEMDDIERIAREAIQGGADPGRIADGLARVRDAEAEMQRATFDAAKNNGAVPTQPATPRDEPGTRFDDRLREKKKTRPPNVTPIPVADDDPLFIDDELLRAAGGY